jgi:PAP2 superfamily
MTTAESQIFRGDSRVERSRLPLRGILQIVVVAWVYILYAGFRNLATGPTLVAFHHAKQILAVERFLHLDVELSIQHFALQTSWLVKACSVCYSATHLVVPAAVLVLLYRRTPARYAVWRDTFLILLAMALVAFALYPTMPPWLMPRSYRFVDTAHVFGSDGPVHIALHSNVGPPSGNPWGFSNPFAAVPSLHATWALWAALAAWPVVRHRWVKVLLAAYPPVMLLSVVVTANHWVLDAVIGVVMLAASWGVARAIDRLRSARWASRNREPAPA